MIDMLFALRPRRMVSRYGEGTEEYMKSHPPGTTWYENRDGRLIRLEYQLHVFRKPRGDDLLYIFVDEYPVTKTLTVEMFRANLLARSPEEALFMQENNMLFRDKAWRG